mmetsp:Transcript_17677/g.30935  ORF Transcript_17677/g.30935 Transcript_17677/m.30935 type:complete len:209 (-) Transcript_17677:103-729(-)
MPTSFASSLSPKRADDAFGLSMDALFSRAVDADSAELAGAWSSASFSFRDLLKEPENTEEQTDAFDTLTIQNTKEVNATIELMADLPSGELAHFMGRLFTRPEASDLVETESHSSDEEVEVPAFDIVRLHSRISKVTSCCNTEECPVCLENLQQGQSVCTLPCFHQLHACCAEEFFRAPGVKPACPVCRHMIEIEAVQGEQTVRSSEE